MRRCPTCNKTYEDALRFCQSDGTQLVDVVQESSIPTPPPTPAGDPFSTAEPPSDPLKTMVASPAQTGAIRHPSAPSEPSQVEPSPFSKPNTPTPWAPSAPSHEEPTSERVEVSIGSSGSGSEEPPTVFAAPMVTFGTPVDAPQSTIESNWTPPPAPGTGWGGQGVGSPIPPAVSGEQNKTLAIVSLVCGILGLTCCGIIAPIAAIITGFMARGKANENPLMYGGSGMAMAGIIMGFLSLIITVVIIILQVALGVMGTLVR